MLEKGNACCSRRTLGKSARAIDLADLLRKSGQIDARQKGEIMSLRNLDRTLPKDRGQAGDQDLRPGPMEGH
jgi:hypothetical protein